MASDGTQRSNTPALVSSARTALHSVGIASAHAQLVSSESYVDYVLSQAVYNLEVAGDHTYFANGVLVHNCDLLANQNLFGLGPGGYPADHLPDTPHTNCTCSAIAIIDRFHARRELARETGRPEPPREWEVGGRETAAEWLAKQPEKFQRELLGPTRFEVFQREPNRVVSAGGEPLPVHAVIGRSPMARASGRRIRVRPILERDRATMVRTLPAAPRIEGEGSPPPEAPPEAAPTIPAPPDLRAIRAQRMRDLGHTERAVREDADEFGGSLTREQLRSHAEGAREAARRITSGEPLEAHHQRAFRGAVRRMMRAADPDLVSADVARLESGRHVFRVAPASMVANAAALHSWEGEVWATERAAQGAARAIMRIADGDPVPTRALTDLHTMMHEELHGSSRITSNAYRGLGAALEEGVVETRARGIAAEIARATRSEVVGPSALPRQGAPTGGAYSRLVDAVTRAVGRVSSATGDDLNSEVQRRIAPLFSTGAAGVSSPQAYLRYVARTMHPDSPEEMERILREELTNAGVVE